MLVKRLSDAFDNRMGGFRRSLLRGERATTAAIDKAKEFREAAFQLAERIERYGIEEQKALKVKEELYDETITKMEKSQEEEKIGQKVANDKRAPKDEYARVTETIWKLLPCPGCGSAPISLGGGKLACGGQDCDFTGGSFTVEDWNKELRMPFLRPNQFRPPKPPERPWENSNRKVKIVEPPKQDPELDVEWARRVRSIGVDDDD